jgi:predicted nucleic acid-binding protein
VIGYLIDSSALWRVLRSADLHELWRPVVVDGDVRSCYPQRAEFLRSARDHGEFGQYEDMFVDLYEDVAVPKNAGSWVAALQRRAAGTGLHRALSAVDSQVCATAAHHGLTVLHDDDYGAAAGLATDLTERNVHDGPQHPA